MATLNKLIMIGAVYYLVGPIPLTIYGVYKYLGNTNIIREAEIVATTITNFLAD